MIRFERGHAGEVKSVMEQSTQPKPKSFRTRARYWWKKEILPLLILALVLFAVRSSLADWNDVPSGSMRPTIIEGDRIFVNKLAYDLKVPFTTLQVPSPMTPDHALHEQLGGLHENIGTIFYYVIGLHIAGALWHHFFRRDDTLKWML